MPGQNTQVGVPSSTGIGAPAAEPAPQNLSTSPMAAAPAQQQQRIPFTRGASLATMQDKQLNAIPAGQPQVFNLLTNSFLAYIILDVNVVGTNTSATVKWNTDGPWSVLQSVRLDDPANQAIVTSISGFKLAQLNKYLTDTACNFDPARDSGFSMLPTAANNGTGSTAATAGSAYFRLVIPVEIRRRDAFGALTNSAANEAMKLTLTTIASYAAGTDVTNNLYSTAPDGGIVVNIQVFQMYWTTPPAAIVSQGASTPASQTPPGLGTVGFIRSERHTEIAGGGSAPFQLLSVGDIISQIVWTLRTSTSTNARDAWTAGNAINTGFANMPPVFNFAVNDFTLLALGQDMWLREMSRFYNLTNGVSAQAGNPGYIDTGVFSFGPFLDSLFDFADNGNFAPANLFLATESGTKLQVRDSVFGSGSQYMEVDVRTIRPYSGATLYS